MRIRRTIIGAVLVLSASLGLSAQAFSNSQFGLPLADPESVGMSSEKLAAIKPKLQPFIDQDKVPGFITIVARDGKVVHFEAFGHMDVERGKPMRPDTIFRMYSMTKPITGAAIMILVQEGKIAVSNPVSKYIPQFAEMEVLIEDDDGSTHTVPADRPITIEHLLTHTSGLIYGSRKHPVAEMYQESGVDSDGASGLTLEEFAKKAASMPLVAHPGTVWNYGISIDILGRVVEVVSGRRYGDFLRDRIFEPLRMKDSGFHVPAEKSDRFAANYGPDKETGGMKLVDDPAKSRYLKIPSQDSGGGGMVGTAADYLRFAQMLVNGGVLDGVRVLSKESVREMTTNHLGPEFGEAPLTSLFPLGMKGVGFGYCGAVVLEGVERSVFGGGGQYSWGGAASTDFWIDKRQRLVGMVLTQLLPSGTYPTRVIMNNATYDAIVESYEQMLAKTFEVNVPIRAITRGPKGHWFSYYDKLQFDTTGRYALGMELDIQRRKPSPDDVIRLGMIDLEDGDRWIELGESRAWGWQQGCMLQWLPGSKSEVLYNDRRGDSYLAVILDVFTGESRTIPRPIYAVSPDGKQGVSVNFARTDDTRPGYGYKGVIDPFADELHPADDGIYLVDLVSGKSRLVVTLDQIASIPRDTTTDGKHWFNHLLYNPDGTRLIFLHRAYERPVKEGKWVTRMFTIGSDGSDLHCVNNHAMVSHFIWRDPRHILAWAIEPGIGRRFFLYEDMSDSHEVIGEGILKKDGHCTYSPDGQWILTDLYPDEKRMQTLMLFRPSDSKLVTLGRFYLPPKDKGEFRCDLHPRWNRSGTHITIDSMHEGGKRQIYLLDVSGITKP